MNYKIYCGDVIEVLQSLPDEHVQCMIASPPYFNLRSYLPADHPDKDKEIGLESHPFEYINKMTTVFKEARRVLKSDGILFINIGDSYSQSGGSGSGDYQKTHTQFGKVIEQGTKQEPRNTPSGFRPKNLLGIPWRLAFSLQADGWNLRQDIIWAKGCSGVYAGGSCMPESVNDRWTRSHEYIFFMTKETHYYFNQKAILEDAHYDGRTAVIKKADGTKYKTDVYMPKGSKAQGCNVNDRSRWPTTDDEGNFKRNKRSVWTCRQSLSREEHYASYPTDLILPLILCSTKENDIVLDPFNGSGTTGIVAIENKRKYIGIDINKKYVDITNKRLEKVMPRLL